MTGNVKKSLEKKPTLQFEMIISYWSQVPRIPLNLVYGLVNWFRGAVVVSQNDYRIICIHT
jgi:hypothetical protein